MIARQVSDDLPPLASNRATRPSCAQARGELASKGTAPWDVQRLVDRVVADAHRNIFGKIDRQAVSDLFGTPRARPPSMGLYKTEVIHRRGPWRHIDAVEYATLEWIDWFNHRRLHEPIGNVQSAELEVSYYQSTRQLPMAA